MGCLEGRRKAKAKAKRNRECKEDEGTLYLKSIDDTLKEATMIEKEKWEAKKKRVEQKALIQEMKVMSQSIYGRTYSRTKTLLEVSAIHDCGAL